VQIEVREGNDADIQRLEPLWRAMLEHHRAIQGDSWPVRPPDESWRRRRQQYRTWLDDGTALLFVAESTDAAELLGYLVCLLVEPGSTFDLGLEYGNVDSLSVAPEARGGGVGGRLLEACRATLREREVAYWSIGVLAGNDGAQRLYERFGFAPWSHTMLGRP
jgi:ribosomal protein S18 acetylase RimI-like enzyme